MNKRDVVKQIGYKNHILFVIFSILLYGALLFVSNLDYTLFHTVAELLSIISAIVIIVIAVGVWDYLKHNTFLSMISIALIFVAFVDLIHIFSYQGTNYFRNYDNNLAAQLWIYARYMQAGSLFAAIIYEYKQKSVNYLYLILVYLLITTVGLYTIFIGVFPDAFVQGEGLTTFKIVSEYIIMFTFATSIYFVTKLPIVKKEKMQYLFVVFLAFQVASEFYFTIFSNLFDSSNFMGHYFKILAMLIFTFIIVKTTLSFPTYVVFEKLKRSEERLQEIAYIDLLTNLGNRRKYEEDVYRISHVNIVPITYIMMDINGLKVFNDSYGHSVGDELIKEVAKTIVDCVRDADKAYRLGGDEFLIVLERTTYQQALEVKGRIVNNLASKTVKNCVISVSFGMSTMVDNSISLQDLFEVTENIMYQNKASDESSRHGENLTVILNSLFEKDEETERHSRRVSNLAIRFGEILDFSSEQMDQLKLTSLLHDIGKIGISEEILNKNGKLTNEEYAVIKTHTLVGNRIISSIRSFEQIGQIILHHHEKWDGSGYPNQVAGEDIPYVSRILTICDAFDAMTSYRTYRETKTVEEAVKELVRCKGTQFDPTLVDLFVKHVDIMTDSSA